MAGDGTTTATVLARAIFKEGLRNIVAGSNPMAVRRGIEKAVDAAVEQAPRAWPRRSPSKEEIAQVGAISANNDTAIGELLADAMEKVGKDGVITVEEGKTTETTLEFVEGMQFDKGYISPYFINQPGDDGVRARRRLHPDPREEDQQPARAGADAREGQPRRGKPLLIIAEDVEGEALTALVVNKLRGVLNVCAVKAPGFGDRRKAMLGDIAVLTGGTVISEDLGIKLENLDARAARPGQEDHRRQGQHDDRPRRRQAGRHPEAGIEQIRKQIEATESDYDSEKFQERLAKLTGGVAIISRRRRDRGRDEAEEGPRRRRAARHPRGGRRRHPARRRRGPAARASRRSRRSVEAPRATRRSASTSSCARSRRRSSRSPTTAAIDGASSPTRSARSRRNIGYDANTGEYVDMIKAGIIDPAKVVRTALQNAASIAGLMLTTEALVTNIKDDEKEGAARAEGSVR